MLSFSEGSYFTTNHEKLNDFLPMRLSVNTIQRYSINIMETEFIDLEQTFLFFTL